MDGDDPCLRHSYLLSRKFSVHLQQNLAAAFPNTQGAMQKPCCWNPRCGCYCLHCGTLPEAIDHSRLQCYTFVQLRSKKHP